MTTMNADRHEATGSAMSRAPLRSYARDVHSQNGEDGIVEEILRRLGALDRDAGEPLWCVEFGAWDGVHLSNTRNLIESHGAHAVLIEPDERRYLELVENTRGFSGVETVRSSVEAFGARRLDAILEGRACPRDFDVLSIDIDGQDSWVWAACVRFAPTVVVIEYNPTIPYAVNYRTPPDQRHGSSLAAMVELASKKGYTLVAVTDVNLVFVRDDRTPELGMAEQELRIEAMTEGLTDFRTSVFVTPEGEVRLLGNRVLMWHGVVLTRGAVQAMPRFLRGHHDALGPLRRMMLRCLVRWTRSRHRSEYRRDERAFVRSLEELRRLQRDDTR